MGRLMWRHQKTTFLWLWAIETKKTMWCLVVVREEMQGQDQNEQIIAIKGWDEDWEWREQNQNQIIKKGIVVGKSWMGVGLAVGTVVSCQAIRSCWDTPRNKRLRIMGGRRGVWNISVRDIIMRGLGCTLEISVGEVIRWDRGEGLKCSSDAAGKEEPSSR